MKGAGDKEGEKESMVIPLGPDHFGFFGAPAQAFLKQTRNF